MLALNIIERLSGFCDVPSYLLDSLNALGADYMLLRYANSSGGTPNITMVAISNGTRLGLVNLLAYGLIRHTRLLRSGHHAGRVLHLCRPTAVRNDSCALLDSKVRRIRRENYVFFF